jgi:predicted Zn finger-like uncharacterized protein
MLIFCPSCQRQLRVPDHATGKQVKCPGCAKVFLAGDGSGGEQIQAPAPRPLPAAPPLDEPDDVPRPRRLRNDDFDEQDILRRDDHEADHRARSTAVWFFVAAGVTIVVALVNMITGLSTGEMMDPPMGGPDRQAYLAGIICGVLGCGTLFIAVNVLIIVAGLQLRSFGVKGWVITGIVLAFVQTLFFGIGALINVFMLIADPADALDNWAPLTVLLSGSAAFLNCFLGIKAIMTLNNVAVSDEFERRQAPRRRRRRD